ncbi:recombinase family protein [Corynebacterium nuruki]|uniref:recombinase family protein n=1 Tax=Corynebacterium nuruki TaxID=1032851 RepID=UPI0039BFEE02
MTTDDSTRVATYLRISLDRYMDGLAIDRQRDNCMVLAERRGWTDVTEYVDQSKSASKMTVTRDAYNALLAKAQAGEIDAVICYRLDRLTRSPRQIEDWIDTGVPVHTVEGGVDLASPSGIAMARIITAFAAEEVAAKAQRQHDAQIQRSNQGRVPTGVRPLGYAQDGSIIETEAAAVHGIYEAVSKGESLRDITRALNGEPIPQPENGPVKNLDYVPKTPRHTHTLQIERNAVLKKKGLPEKEVCDPYPWRYTTLHNILRNPRYAGYAVYRDRTKPKKGEVRDSAKYSGWRKAIIRGEDGEPIKAQWEQIIDPVTWWQVQAILDDPTRKTNRFGKNKRKHLGSGLFTCCECGSTVRTHSTRYRCAGHLMRSMEQVDGHVNDVMAARLSQPDLADLLHGADDGEARELSAQIEAHQARIARAQADYDAEIIEGPDLKRVRERERAAIDRLTGQRNRMTVGGQASAILGARDPADAYLNGTMAERRAVIDVLCTVVLHPAPRGHRAFNPDSVEFRWRGTEQEG